MQCITEYLHRALVRKSFSVRILSPGSTQGEADNGKVIEKANDSL